eukprot:366052-Chlamydomonas_euryale.AAC.11
MNKTPRGGVTGRFANEAGGRRAHADAWIVTCRSQPPSGAGTAFCISPHASAQEAQLFGLQLEVWGVGTLTASSPSAISGCTSSGSAGESHS